MTKIFSCDGIDLSLFTATHFKLVFTKLPEMEFWCQSVTIPSVEMSVVTQSTPFLDVIHQGEKRDFSPFSCEILLDKGMKSWNEIYKWMKEISVQGGATGTFSDCLLSTDDVTFHFKDVLPIRLDQIPLSIAVVDIEPITFDVSFRYDYFDIV